MNKPMAIGSSGFTWGNRLFLTVLVLLSLSTYAPQLVAKAACQTHLVSTSLGEVCGLEQSVGEQTAQAFLGIPFAQTTAASNRFKPPVPADAWALPFAATEYGSICPQPLLPGAAPSTMSEDCLNLNLWRPASATPQSKLPVMVFIYGGAFVMGDNTYGLYDGAYLAANKDVIVVNLNYRLGAFGFFVGDDIAGNVGLLDQQLALKWVRENIAAFGGDPEKVTLFGQSAGAMSVGLHTFSIPSSHDLFRAAIMESNVLGVPYKTIEQQEHVSSIFMTVLGCQAVDCVREKSVDALLQAQTATYGSLKKVFSSLIYFVPFGPVIDGELVTVEPMQAAKGYRGKPILLGSNLTDAKLFVGTQPISNIDMLIYAARAFGVSYPDVLKRYPFKNPQANVNTWTTVQTDYLLTCAAKAMAQSVQSPAYLYRFDHTPSFAVWGGAMCQKPGVVCHGAELPFVFHSPEMIGGKFTPAEEKLANQVVNYWTNFAKYLDPNGRQGDRLEQVDWPEVKVDGPAMISLQTPLPKVLNALDHESCGLWDSVGYDLRYPWISRHSQGN